MCVSPLKIINNASYVDPTCSKYYRLVPCGRCYQCRNRAVNDWTVRNFAEYKASVATYFYTLTFSEVNVPRYNDILCFDKQLIQKFLKRLRKHIGAYDKRVVLRYFVSSELGEHTHRPHYHALFYISADCSRDTKRDDEVVIPSASQFYNWVYAAWQYGFIKSGDNLGLVNSAAGIKYVIKYLLKTDTYYDNFARSLFYRVAKKWLSKYKSFGLARPPKDTYGRGYLIANHEIDYPSCSVMRWNNFVYCARKEYARYASHHMQSATIGRTAVDMYNDVDNTCSDIALTNNYHYACPRSVSRAKYYDRVYTYRDYLHGNQYATSYRVNGDGIAYYSRHITKRINDMYNNILDVVANLSHSSSAVVSEMCNVPQSYVVDLCNLTNADMYKLAVYNVVYRYVHWESDYYAYRYSDILLQPLNIRKFVRTQLSQSRIHLPRLDFVRNCNYHLSHEMDVFQSCEEYSTIIDIYNEYFNKLKSAHKMSELRNLRKLKSKLYNL